jgi:hypothetical protein
MIIILSKKYKYLNHFALIHLVHTNSTSNYYLKDDNYFLSVLFLGNTLFDYHINKNPKDIAIFYHYYLFSHYAFNKGKKLFPKLYKFLIHKVINNEYLSYKQKKFYQKEINLNASISKYMKIFEYENIYNYQITKLNNNKNNIINISDMKISIIIFCTEYKYLDKTINSIQNQKFSHYEIILYMITVKKIA